MRTLVLTFFMLVIYSDSFCQTVYLKSNISGKHRITYNEIDQEIIDITAGNFYVLDNTETLEIEFDENESTIVFMLSNLGFEKNDTLTINFIQYHSIDTVNYSSSCIDGSKSEVKESYVERNKGLLEVEELPDSITVLINSRKILLQKSVDSFILISSGSGKKDGKRWGFSSSRRTRRAIYSN